MRVVRNIGHVKRRKRAAKWTAVLGFAVLAAALALGFVPDLFWLAYLLLFLGFILFNIGMQQVGKWNRGPKYRNDSLLDQKLAPFSDKYVLIHYAMLGDKVVEHLLVHPGGVLVLTARELAGDVSVRGSRWRIGGSPLRRLFRFSGPQLGRPAEDTRKSLDLVDEYLTTHQFQVDLAGAIVFVNPRVDLDVDDPEYEVLTADELPDFVRDLPPDETIKQAEQRRLIDLLSTGEEIETTTRTRTRRPVKKRAA